AEDGIRDFHVTGVQTCALPIWYGHSTFGIDADGTKIIVDPFLKPNNPVAPVSADDLEADFILVTHGHGDHVADLVPLAKRTGAQIGRASCRERGKSSEPAE